MKVPKNILMKFNKLKLPTVAGLIDKYAVMSAPKLKMKTNPLVKQLQRYIVNKSNLHQSVKRNQALSFRQKMEWLRDFGKEPFGMP